MNRIRPDPFDRLMAGSRAYMMASDFAFQASTDASPT